jgi:hypothetical protein
VMFVTMARMDRAATSNIADNKMLESAARSIIEIIEKELVLDTPGIVAIPSQEYYDYADKCDPWLASLQPYFYSDNGTPANPNDDIYRWHQISDVTEDLWGKTEDVNVKPVGFIASAKYVPDYPVIKVNPTTGEFLDYYGNPADDGVSADADGDGIADSKWIKLKNLSTSKGQRIYAAVRVIDNGGMININTAHSFDANSADGSSQMQVNLKKLLKGDSINTLHNARCGSASQLWPDYETNVIWQYGVPTGGYVPLDISDELELRYRYCIDSKFRSRIENNLSGTVQLPYMGDHGNLYDSSDQWGLGDWEIRITNPCDPNADRRHVLTAYNLDRVIDPYGIKMFNINDASVKDLYDAIRNGILDADSNFLNVNKVSAQIAANIKDYRDIDSNVTDFNNTDDNTHYYGFEQPCIYISELAFRQWTDANTSPATVYRSYAVELYKPYSGDEDPNGWKLSIDSIPAPTVDIKWSGSKQYHVIKWENSNAPLDVNSGASVQNKGDPGANIIFGVNNTIWLRRGVGSGEIVVDSIIVPVDFSSVADGSYSVQRDITPNKCIRRIWDTAAVGSGAPTLGSVNTYANLDSIYIQAHPKNSDFTNIGEIGMIFRRYAYEPISGSPIGPSDTEADVLVNLRDPNFQQLFKYLTVIDPYMHGNPYAEKRVKGRININTAPWYVIAQLPWVELRKNSYDSNSLAKAIVAYRDKTDVFGSPPDYSDRPYPGIESIGQLCNVIRGGDDYRIDYYSRLAGDQGGFPDLTPSDGAANDFEERDLIFTRISNLVTVRSDVFTAYILVRIGTDGPQKRYMAILDRSGVYKDPVTGIVYDKVKIGAFQTVPEAR